MQQLPLLLHSLVCLQRGMHRLRQFRIVGILGGLSAAHFLAQCCKEGNE